MLNMNLYKNATIKTSRRKVRSHNRKLYRPCVTHYSRACWCRASGKTFNVPCTMEREYSGTWDATFSRGQIPASRFSTRIRRKQVTTLQRSRAPRTAVILKCLDG